MNWDGNSVLHFSLNENESGIQASGSFGYTDT